MSIKSELSKCKLKKRIDHLEKRLDLIYKLLFDVILNIKQDENQDQDDDENLSKLLSNDKIHKRFTEWIFNNNDDNENLWSKINDLIDRKLLLQKSTTVNDNKDQDQGYKSLTTMGTATMAIKNTEKKQKHIIYQLIMETNEPIILAGFLSSDMMLLFNGNDNDGDGHNTLFTIIRKRPEKLIIFIDNEKIVENFLKYCHYNPSTDCWKLSLNNRLPSINILLEKSIYYD